MVIALCCASEHTASLSRFIVACFLDSRECFQQLNVLFQRQSFTVWRHLTFHSLSPNDPVTSFSRFNGFVSPANAPRMCRRRLVSLVWFPMGSWYFYISLELLRSAVKTGVSSTCFFIMFRFSGLTTLIRDFVHAKL